MPTSTLASIIAGRLLGIPGRWIQDRDPRITNDAKEQLAILAKHWSETRSMLCRDNTVGPDARSLDAILGWIRYRAMASNGKLQLAIIDHLHLIQRPARAASTDWVEQCSGAIKACAASLNIPILVLAQMTKDGSRATKDSKTGQVTGTPEPVMQDLRGAAALGNDAAQVVFVHDPQAGTDRQTPSRPVRILVRKNRYGPCRGFDAIFNAPIQSFSCVPEAERRKGIDDDTRMKNAAATAADWTSLAHPNAGIQAQEIRE
jgi:replicative DNA helicase